MDMRLPFLAVVACLTSLSPAAAQNVLKPRYAATLLWPSLREGGPAIGPQGAVVDNPAWYRRLPVARLNGDTVVLESLGGTRAAAHAVSRNAVVVGECDVAADYHPRACRWDERRMPTELPGREHAIYASAWAVNSLGDVVGSSESKDFTQHATLWQGTTLIDLAPLPGDIRSVAFGINDAGVIVGLSDPGRNGAHQHAVTWTAAGAITRLPDLGGHEAAARAVNSSGIVVGHSRDRSYQDQAVAWMDGRAINLQPAGSQHSSAQAINDAGDIVGTMSVAVVDRAVLWHDGRAFDLNDLVDPALEQAGIVLAFGQGISDGGEIVVAAVDAREPFTYQTYLLTPIGP
jgi:probable HAF family extracellular repeat protein